MNTIKKLTLKISISDDYCDNFDHGIVELTASNIKRIKQLAKAAAELGVFKISEFDYSVTTMVSDHEAEQSDNGKQPLSEPEEGRVECPLLNVENNCFYWSGLVKNTDSRWSTDTIPLSVLDEPGDYDKRDNFPDSGEPLIVTSGQPYVEEPAACKQARGYSI